MLLRGNPRALNFDLACAAVLQRFDLEHDEAQCNKMAAATWGVETNSKPSSQKPSPAKGQKKVMTKQDIMRNYGR